MKAMVFHEFGGTDVLKLEHCPPPEPTQDQVLIKVAGVGLNPIDCKAINGRVPWVTSSMPMIPGFECSGVIEKVGRGVTEFSPGDRVFGVVMRSMAEYALAPAASIALAPPSLDLADAAVVPVCALTAYQALFDQGNLQANQRVLIHAAAGGVGCFAVQLAKWKGAYVIGTASATNEHFVCELGADEFIDYRSHPFEEGLEPVDLVIDSVGGDVTSRSEKVLKKGGRLIAIADRNLDTELFETNEKIAYFWSMQPNVDQLKIISSLIEDLHLRVIVTGQVHFDNVAKGIDLLQQGHVRGKLLCLP